MSVKRYECGLTNAPTEYQSPTMYQDANGGYVSYEDYAALEARCAALAAENAGMKQETPDLQTMMSALDAFFADEEVPERAMLEAYNILRGAVETPATDAFLAEVRAQGVEMFADSLLCPDLDDTIREFADELRKGVPS